MRSLVQTGTKLHVPVMLEEVLNLLDISPNGIYLDGTIGTGGHSTLILERLSSKGCLIGIDRDKEAIDICRRSLFSKKTPFYLFNDCYSNFEYIIQQLGIDQVNGIILDLGLSSLQLDSSTRGFSYKINSNLDMRFNLSQKFSAYDLINNASHNDLANLIFNNSQERRSRLIAKSIVNMRPLKTVYDLVEAIRRSTPPNHRNKTIARVFQSIRIAVNDEIVRLEKILSSFHKKLVLGGRIIIISFHSVEDRKVKHCFKKLQTEKKIKILTKKPITPTQGELKVNSRSKSAKMRVAEKIA